MGDNAPKNRIQEAAEKAGVTLGEFKMWLLEHATVTSQRWSKWNHGVEPIPDRYVIMFLRDKLDQMIADRGALKVIEGTAAEMATAAEILKDVLPDIARIEHSVSPLRLDTIEHLRRQIRLFAEAIGRREIGPPLTPPDDPSGTLPIVLLALSFGLLDWALLAMGVLSVQH